MEGSLSRLFADGLHPQEVAAKLARAMEDSADGNVAPDRYQVHVCQEDYEGLLSVEPQLAQILTGHLVVLAEQAGLTLRHDPEVEFVPDLKGARQSIAVVAGIREEEREFTRAFEPVKMQEPSREEPDGSIYLIVDGGRHFALNKTLYTLGRRLDCDIVLSDARVSRRHAQLRWRAGRFVLFDLGSTGGTTVNGHRIREAVLEPGDVFSLGGVDVIFGIEVSEGEPGVDQAPTRPWGGARGGTRDGSPETT